MDDTTAQYFIAVGSLFEAARLARLPVVVRAAGRELVGVPDAPPAEAAVDVPLDDTGLAAHVYVGETRIGLRDIEAVVLRRPAAAAAAEAPEAPEALLGSTMRRASGPGSSDG